MLLPLSLALALNASTQVGQPPARATTFVRDSTVADSTKPGGPRRLPVTAEVLATAFADAPTRELFARARAARMAQDSSLRSYDATVRARMSIGLGIGERGGERLAFRQEAVSTVRWDREIGARMEVVGARYVAPIIGTNAARERSLEDIADGVGVIPYFPGYEPLWIGGTARSEVDERGLVNPLADGAEAYYTYALGDSVRIALPAGGVVWLREIEVRPRSATSNLAVGSLMFDIASGNLVRATYRLAAPIDISSQMIRAADSNTTARPGSRSRRESSIRCASPSPRSRSPTRSTRADSGSRDRGG